MTVIKGFIHQIKDLGCEHAQYFQGDGVAFTYYDYIAVGCGSSAHEAGEDALEQFWMQIDKNQISVAEMERLEAEINALSEEEDAHAGCHDVWLTSKNDESDFDKWHEGCELNHYVSIKWALGRDRT